MANKVDVVIQHALRVFTKYIKKLPEYTSVDLRELKTLTDDLSASDIHSLQGLLGNRNLLDFMRKRRTSLDYVPVYEDDCITVGVFLLSTGAKLPIHDHPDMYGIIKVLQGILKVTSYSLQDLDRTIQNNDKYLFYNNPLKVIKHPEVLLGSGDTSCILTPTEKNIHEVECIEGPAAFLDILSPPYVEGEANEPRTCHYFEEIESGGDDYLSETEEFSLGSWRKLLIRVKGVLNGIIDDVNVTLSKERSTENSLRTD